MWVAPGVPTPIAVGYYNKDYEDPPGLPAMRQGPGWREVLIDGDTRFDIELVDAQQSLRSHGPAAAINRRSSPGFGDLPVSSSTSGTVDHAAPRDGVRPQGVRAPEA